MQSVCGSNNINNQLTPIIENLLQTYSKLLENRHRAIGVNKSNKLQKNIP